jgi:methylated-DNA-[protein]-cysteine S-methyltransferase
MIYTLCESPIGELLLLSNGKALTGLYMQPHRGKHAIPAGCQRDDAWFRPVVQQLHSYFAGELADFDVECALDGTPFQQRVWKALRKIPHGETISYGTLAKRVGRPGAARAVGAAVGQNPICIILPCHRVIGADGSLTGFGGGLDRKRTLLELESAVPV